MKNTLYVLLSILFIVGCNQDDDGHQVQFYNFEANLTVVNPQTKYLVGETIWFTVTIPDKMLTDAATGKSINVENATFPLTFTPLHFFEGDSTLLLHERINYIPDSTLKRPNADYPAEVAFEFGCPDEVFTLNFGVRFKDKGHFMFQLNQPFGSNPDDPTNLAYMPIPQNGVCGELDLTQTDFATMVYVFDTPEDNRSAYEAFMQQLINDPHNWDPVATQQALEAGKKSFDKQWAFFATVE